MKQEIEAKYADTISLINKKKEELESKKQNWKGNYLYMIQSYMPFVAIGEKL